MFVFFIIKNYKMSESKAIIKVNDPVVHVLTFVVPVCVSFKNKYIFAKL